MHSIDLLIACLHPCYSLLNIAGLKIAIWRRLARCDDVGGSPESSPARTPPLQLPSQPFSVLGAYRTWGIRTFICSQKYSKQCCKGTEVDCHHYAGLSLSQWLQLACDVTELFVFKEPNKPKISGELGCLWWCCWQGGCSASIWLRHLSVEGFWCMFVSKRCQAMLWHHKGLLYSLL